MSLSPATARVSLEHLMKLRLAVARFGEMDAARWWNTNGILGSRGAAVMGRGFPRTASFAQARVALAVAAVRSQEVFAAPNSITLWSLTPELEDEFGAEWQRWLDDSASWAAYFKALEPPPGDGLVDYLEGLGLTDKAAAEAAGHLRRSHENRAVQLGTFTAINDELLTLLVLGFSLGEPGKLAVPFATLGAAE